MDVTLSDSIIERKIWMGCRDPQLSWGNLLTGKQNFYKFGLYMKVRRRQPLSEKRKKQNSSCSPQVTYRVYGKMDGTK